MPTDTTETGLEDLIVTAITTEAGFILGDPRDYDRDHAVDLA
jgi:type I restriction enzyme, R subunit